jgi:hypothetical protein
MINGRFIRPANLKREYATTTPAFKEPRGQIVLRMIGQTGVNDFRYAWMRSQPFRDLPRILALLAHSQGESLQAAQRQPCFKWTESASDKFVQLV